MRRPQAVRGRAPPGGVASRALGSQTVSASPYSEQRNTLNRRAAARASGPDAATGELAASRPALGLGPHTLTHVHVPRHVTGPPISGLRSDPTSDESDLRGISRESRTTHVIVPSVAPLSSPL